MRQIDTKTITTVIESLLGGSAEPYGDTAIDDVKFEIQKAEEELIDWLIDDLFRCLEYENVYWGSGKHSGSRARYYLSILRDEINERLEIER